MLETSVVLPPAALLDANRAPLRLGHQSVILRQQREQRRWNRDMSVNHFVTSTKNSLKTNRVCGEDGEAENTHLYSNSESAYFSEYNMATGMDMVTAIEMDDYDGVESMSSRMMSRE